MDAQEIIDNALAAEKAAREEYAKNPTRIVAETESLYQDNHYALELYSNGSLRFRKSNRDYVELSRSCLYHATVDDYREVKSFVPAEWEGEIDARVKL